MTGLTLILLPGMDGSGQLFDSFIAALGGAFNVKVVRYPVDAPLGYDGLEQIARAAIPPAGPVVLLGESFSGPIAVSLAASLSERLAGLILCCTFVRNPLPMLSGLRGSLDRLPVGRIPVSVFSYALLGLSATKSLRAAHAASLVGVTPEALRERMRAVLAVDVSEKLSQLRAPLLYLRAKRDWVVPRAAGEWIVKLAPRTQVVEFDAPHFLLQTVPTESARVVAEFCSQIQDAPSDRTELR